MQGEVPKNERFLVLNQGHVATCEATSRRDRELNQATSRRWKQRRDVTESIFNPRRDVKSHVATWNLTSRRNRVL